MKADVYSTSKPRIFQKYIRESNPFFSPKKEKTRDAAAETIHIETQTEWSWLQDLLYIEGLRKTTVAVKPHVLGEFQSLTCDP